MKRLISTLAVAATGLMVSTAAANAITCRQDAQLSGGRWIVTPYCQDHYLTQVARSYGLKVSFEAIRYNVSEKQRVCFAVGHDSRVSHICSQYRPEGRGKKKLWIN